MANNLVGLLNWHTYWEEEDSNGIDSIYSPYPGLETLICFNGTLRAPSSD